MFFTIYFIYQITLRFLIAPIVILACLSKNRHPVSSSSR